jgi:PPE-repeat protein
MFRDESQSLTIKHQRLKETQAQKEPRASPVSELPLAFEANLALVTPALQPVAQLEPLSPLSLSLGTSPEDQATCFFFQNYVLGQQLVLSKGNFDYLTDLFGTEEIGSGLADSIAAIGMSGLANFWKAPNLMSYAAIKYNCAMRTISSQLRDPQQFKSDQTFISILMMGLYEVLSTLFLKLR